MAICQAVERSGGRSMCIGVEQGQIHWPEALHQSHESDYSSFSTLLSNGDHFDPERLIGGADMLIIHDVPDSDHPARLSEASLDGLSDRGIVLTIEAARTLRGTDLEDSLLTQDSPVLRAGPTSPAGTFLDLTLWGGTQPNRLRTLVQADETSDLYLSARQVFKRLGTAVKDAQQVAALRREYADVYKSAEAPDPSAPNVDALRPEAVTPQRNDLDSLRIENTLLQEDHAERKEDIAALTNEYKSKLTAVTDENAALRTRCEQAEAAKASGEKAYAAQLKQLQQLHERELSELQAENTRLEEAQAERIEDIAVLTNEFRSRLATATDEITTIRTRCEQAEAAKASGEKAYAAQLKQLQLLYERDLAELRSQRAELEVLHENTKQEFYTSTSWRITRPMRWLKSTLKGR